MAIRIEVEYEYTTQVTVAPNMTIALEVLSELTKFPLKKIDVKMLEEEDDE